MRRYLNVSRRIRNIKNKLDNHMYLQCHFFCNGLIEHVQSPQARQSFLNCHNTQLDRDSLFDRKHNNNVYHY